MLEIGRNGQRLDGFVGKLLREDLLEARAEFFTIELARGTLKIQANEFEAMRFGASKALNGKCETVVGMVGDGQDAGCKVALLRLRVRKRFLSGAAHFPGQAGERGEASPVLAHFHGARGGKLA